ncbi:MAG: hypothetical protein WC941_02105 [Candidatus Bathyarchaeia archaeon]
MSLKGSNPFLCATAKPFVFESFEDYLKGKRLEESTIEAEIKFVKHLGYKSIKNTLIYTHLVDFEEDNSFIVKVASTIQEFTQLLESGFEYVSDFEGRKVLRKRK